MRVLSLVTELRGSGRESESESRKIGCVFNCDSSLRDAGRFRAAASHGRAGTRRAISDYAIREHAAVAGYARPETDHAQ